MTNQSATLVNHLLVTPILSVLRSVQSVGLSDYRCQILEVDTPVIQPSKYILTVRSFHHCPWGEVRECLCSAPWQVMDVYDSVDDMWSWILLDCLETFSPAKTCRFKISHHRPTLWLSPSLPEAIKKKQQAERKAERTGDNELQKVKKLLEGRFFSDRPRFLTYNN